MKTIFDTMPEVSSVDPYPTLEVFTISQANITAQPDIGINVGNYFLIGDPNTGWKLQPMVISGSNINIGSSSFAITAEQKTAWDALSLSFIGTYDPHPPLSGFTITEDNLTAQPNLAVVAGNYTLLGDNVSGWKLLPIDITNPAFVASGASINITPEQKAAWDALILTPLIGNYDPHGSSSVVLLFQ